MNTIYQALKSPAPGAFFQVQLANKFEVLLDAREINSASLIVFEFELWFSTTVVTPNKTTHKLPKKIQIRHAKSALIWSNRCIFRDK